MNCKHVQELMPLYVGRDLKEKQVNQITAHVQSCTACASSADEYRKTRQLLRQFEPPAFSDAFYAGIRQRVLQEIRLESSTQTLPQSVARFFGPRIGWALATALLLAMGLFAIYVSSIRRDERRELANNPRAVDGATPDERRDSRSQDKKTVVTSLSSNDKNDGVSAGPAGGRKIGSASAIARSADRPKQLQRQKSRGAGLDESWAPTSNSRSLAVEAFSNDKTLVDPDAAAGRVPSSTQKTLRMEIQTKDRNIRIIWFSHQKQGASNESYKGI